MSARVYPIGSPRDETKPTRMMLFVAGEEINSRKARANLDWFCREHLHGSCDIEIVDVFADHAKALEWKVLLTPALVVLGSGAPIRITGNLDDAERVAAALALRRGQGV